MRLFDGPLVTVSQGVKQALIKRTNVPMTHNSTVIPNGIDGRWVEVQAQVHAVSRQGVGLCEDTFVIGSVGRLCLIKNYSFLVEIFSTIMRYHTNVRLVLVGSGPEERHLRDLVMQHGLANKVIFIVGQPAYGYYRLFDCFVQSSREGISMALLEAMSLKVPCVVACSDTEHPVIKDGVNGLVMPTNDAYECAQTIEKIIENITLRTTLGSRGQKTVLDQFDNEKMFQLYHTLFKRMVK